MMKKLKIASLALLSIGMLTLNGCKKDDTEAPVITLLGSDVVTLPLNTNYVDLGATATDNEDGANVTVTTDASEVNKDLVGSYEVTYSAVDAAGNEGTATRTVNVVNQMTTSPWTGSYDIKIQTVGQLDYNYIDGASISNTLNNGLTWAKFGDYSNATAKLDFLVNSNNSVSVPSQTFTCGSPLVLRTFSGSGVVTSGTGATGSKLTVNIQETTNGQTITSIYTFTKQ